MKQEIGILQFFECGLEGSDQIFGEIANEADGIREDDFLQSWEPELSARGVEGGKEQVLGIDVCFGQGVEQGGLAGVGVADEAEDGDLVGVTPLSQDLAVIFALLEGSFERLHAFPGFSPVDFEFGFARAPAADATHKPAHGGVFVDKFWQIIAQLSKFDLELAVDRLGALGENVEDELGSVEHFARQDTRNGTCLGGGKLAIKDDEFGFLIKCVKFDLLKFAGADERFGIGF